MIAREGQIGFRRPDWRLIGAGVLTLIGLGVIYAIPPGKSSLYPPCPFHWLTGLHCPGCGTLRCLHALTHGQIARSFAWNPFTVVTLLVMAGMVIRRAVAYLKRRPTPTKPTYLPASVIWALFAVIILFWILRNIPRYPFDLLAPG